MYDNFQEIPAEALETMANPRTTVPVFVLLTFLFSSIFWYLTSQTALVPDNADLLMIYAVGAMWGPALAAVVTRLTFQHNLRGFTLSPGKPFWLGVSILLPIGAGLLMFGTAWITDIAPFNRDNVAIIFSITFLPALLYALGFNCFAAAGEEFGWRGFLVPELGRFMGFTHLAFISSAIWVVWHFPMMFLGGYHGAGPILYSLAVFIPSVMGAGFILAWLRFASGSVWPAVLFHGFWNYFIQHFYPALTKTTDAGGMMLGEFGWFVAVFYVILALIFWHFRDRLPKVSDKAIDLKENQITTRL